MNDQFIWLLYPGYIDADVEAVYCSSEAAIDAIKSRLSHRPAVWTIDVDDSGDCYLSAKFEYVDEWNTGGESTWVIKQRPVLGERNA